MRTELLTAMPKAGARIAAENRPHLRRLGMPAPASRTTQLTSDDEPRKTVRRTDVASDAADRQIRQGSSRQDRSARQSSHHRYMTTEEAAAYLKLSRQYLEAARYRGDGSGPPYVKLERAVRYRRSVLDAWMSAHDHSPDKPIYTE